MYRTLFRVPSPLSVEEQIPSPLQECGTLPSRLRYYGPSDSKAFQARSRRCCLYRAVPRDGLSLSSRHQKQSACYAFVATLGEVEDTPSSIALLRPKASSLRKARKASLSTLFRSVPSVTCYVSLRQPGESHALEVNPYRLPEAALPKPISISVPKPCFTTGSAAKPYLELPPHTAPLGIC